MVQSFAVNSNNDIYIGKDGNLAIATGIQAVLFATMQASLAQLGSMIYATNQGVPDFQSVWVGAPNIPQFESYLRAAILSVPGVIQVVSLTTQQVENVLNYVAIIQTEFGQVSVSSNGGNVGIGVLLNENGQPLLLENGGEILLE